jgi:hypothetical protein
MDFRIRFTSIPPGNQIPNIQIVSQMAAVSAQFCRNFCRLPRLELAARGELSRLCRRMRMSESVQVFGRRDDGLSTR